MKSKRCYAPVKLIKRTLTLWHTYTYTYTYTHILIGCYSWTTFTERLQTCWHVLLQLPDELHITVAPQSRWRARLQCLRPLLQAAQCGASADHEEGHHTGELFLLLQRESALVNPWLNFPIETQTQTEGHQERKVQEDENHAGGWIGGQQQCQCQCLPQCGHAAGGAWSANGCQWWWVPSCKLQFEFTFPPASLSIFPFVLHACLICDVCFLSLSPPVS